MLDCQSAQEDCIAKNKELAQQKLDNITEEYETFIGFAEAVKSSSEAMVNMYSASGQKAVNSPETMAQINTQMELQRQISSYYQYQISYFEQTLQQVAAIFGETSTEYIQNLTALEEMRKGLTESETALYNLRNQVMELNFKPLEFAMEKLQSFGKRLESVANLYQKRSIYPTEGDINKQVNNNNAMIENALRQYEMAVNNISQGLDVNGDEYQKWAKIMRTASDTIIDLRTQNEELKVEILNIRWKSFEDLHKQIDQTVDDFEWLGKQIKDSQIFDDDGQGWNLTSKGAAAIAMLGETMARHKGNIADYRQALSNLQKQLEENPEMADVLNERIEEYIQKIKDESDALEDNKNKLIDYYKTGIQNENEALQKNIQLRSEALSKQKEYNDYAKQLQNQNRDRNKIQAQINALQGSSNLQARAEVARLREQLYEADRELSDTRKNHRYDLLSEGYSKLAEDANESLDKTLRSLDANSELQLRVVENMLGTMTTNYDNAYSSINDIISETGVVIHDTTEDAIDDLKDATSALSAYSSAVIETLKTTSSQIANGISTDKINTSTPLAEYAESVSVNTNEDSLKATSQQAYQAQEAERQQAEQERQNQIASLNSNIAHYEATIDQVNQTLKANEDNRDASYMGYLKNLDNAKATKDKKKKEKYLAKAQEHLNNYNTAVNQINSLERARDDYLNTLDSLQQQLHALNSYKKGTNSILEDELAWTHEGEIIRRSDGAILRQLPAGTQVIPKVASENLLKWAQIDPFKELKEGFKGTNQITNTSNNAPVFYYDSIIHIDGNVDADMMDRVEQLGKALLSSNNFKRGMVDKVTQEYKREFNKRY